MREIVSSMLISSHYECRGVASPKEALDILSSGEQFDLILCGLLETQEDNFFKRVGEHFPDIPLVVLRACHGFSMFSPALRDGAYDYLMKPFEREQLIFAIRRALECRRLKLENLEYKARLEKLAKISGERRSASDLQGR
jgi:DNA-binding NtrC family response regulator